MVLVFRDWCRVGCRQHAVSTQCWEVLGGCFPFQRTQFSVHKAPKLLCGRPPFTPFIECYFRGCICHRFELFGGSCSGDLESRFCCKASFLSKMFQHPFPCLSAFFFCDEGALEVRSRLNAGCERRETGPRNWAR